MSRRSTAWYSRTKAALRERDGDDCWICKCPTTNGNRTLDHWLPVSRGGSDDMENLKLAHAECNRRRGNALPEDTHSLPAVRRAAQVDGRRMAETGTGSGRSPTSPVVASSDDAPNPCDPSPNSSQDRV